MSDPTFPVFPDPGFFERQESRPTDLDTYGDLDGLLIAGERLEVLDVPAESRESAISGEANRVRGRVVAERLWLLGYLSDVRDVEDPRDAMRWGRFLEAVRVFQRDAGLEPDSWVGERTWRALQRLVSFETPTDVRRFADGDEPRRALIRALRLRLWALGLLKERPTPNAKHDPLPTRGLSRFWMLFRRLKMADFGAPAPPTLALIEHVFDQATLVEGAARSSVRDPRHSRRRLFQYLGDPKQRRKVDPQVRSFLVNLVKIELWLLGFDVDIDGKADYLVRGFEGGGGVRRSRKLRAALKEFWTTLKPTSRARRRAFVDRITPELFDALADPPARRTVEPESLPAGDYSIQVSEALRDDDEIEQAWSTGRRLGMKIWDGLNRLWRWLRRGFRHILDVGRNLFRAFYRYASKSYEIVRFSTRTIVQSTSQYLRGAIDMGGHPGVGVLLAGDGDFRVAIDPGAGALRIRQSAQAVRYFGDAFHLSCRILAEIVGIIRDVATGAVGWARLLWTLARSYAEIRPYYRAVRALPKPDWI